MTRIYYCLKQSHKCVQSQYIVHLEIQSSRGRWMKQFYIVALNFLLKRNVICSCKNKMVLGRFHPLITRKSMFHFEGQILAIYYFICTKMFSETK